MAFVKLEKQGHVGVITIDRPAFLPLAIQGLV